MVWNIAACVNEYFYGEVEVSGDIKSSEGPIYKGYKAVLDSKSRDETLVSYQSCFDSFKIILSII